MLSRDPSSHLCASVNGWDYPLSREAALLADLFDLTAAAHSKRRPRPHPIRPWASKGKTERYGNTGGRTNAEVAAILARAKGGI